MFSSKNSTPPMMGAACVHSCLINLNGVMLGGIVLSNILRFVWKVTHEQLVRSCIYSLVVSCGDFRCLQLEGQTSHLSGGLS